MYLFHYPQVTSLQKTIHNCSTETLTRGPADFPYIPTSWTIVTCYSNLDCSYLKFSTWFFSCNSNIVPWRVFPSYCQSCPLPSPEAVPACLDMSLKTIHSSFSSFLQRMGPNWMQYITESSQILKTRSAVFFTGSNFRFFFFFLLEATFLSWKSCS